MKFLSNIDNLDRVNDGSGKVSFTPAERSLLSSHTADTNLHEALGLDRNNLPSLSFDNVNRRLTASGDHVVYFNGNIYNKTTTSIDLDDTIGLWFIYYNSSGILVKSTDPWNIADTVQVATVYWNGASGIIGDERHGVHMDRVTHEYLHETVGTRYAFGLAGTFSATGFTIGPGEWYDEDIEHETEIDTTTLDVFYRTASGWSWVSPATKYFHEDGGGTLYYDSSGVLTAADNNYHVAYWIYATNHLDKPFISVMGQRQDLLIANAKANNVPENLVWGELPLAEKKLLYRVILKSTGANETVADILDYRTVSAMPGSTYVATDHGTLTGLSDLDHPAAAITANTASFNGQLTATEDTVQKALDKLDDHTHVEYSASGHTHVGYAAVGSGMPSTQAFGDAAASGTSEYAARLDHKHAMPTAKVTVSANASASGTQEANFSTAGAYTYSLNGNITVNVTNVASGQRGSVHVYCDNASGRTLSWGSGTTIKWVGGAPASGLTQNKLLAVTLFNDGINTVGSWGLES